MKAGVISIIRKLNTNKGGTTGYGRKIAINWKYFAFVLYEHFLDLLKILTWFEMVLCYFNPNVTSLKITSEFIPIIQRKLYSFLKTGSSLVIVRTLYSHWKFGQLSYSTRR